MMTKKILLVSMAAAILMISFISGAAQVKNESNSASDHTLKIISFLDRVARLRERTGRSQGKLAEFDEKEANAYFKYLFAEQVPAARTIELKLFPQDKVEGRLLLDLRSYNLPSYFKDEVNLYFSARLECSEHKVRLLFNSLYLENQRIRPELVDYLVDLVTSSQGLESGHLEDWYELPPGVDKLSTGQGKLIVYY